jgi:hypothetical protein
MVHVLRLLFRFRLILHERAGGTRRLAFAILFFEEVPILFVLCSSYILVFNEERHKPNSVVRKNREPDHVFLICLAISVISANIFRLVPGDRDHATNLECLVCIVHGFTNTTGFLGRQQQSYK